MISYRRNSVVARMIRASYGALYTPQDLHDDEQAIVEHILKTGKIEMGEIYEQAFSQEPIPHFTERAATPEDIRHPPVAPRDVRYWK